MPEIYDWHRRDQCGSPATLDRVPKIGVDFSATSSVDRGSASCRRHSRTRVAGRGPRVAGEKIDIFPGPYIATFVVNALAPAEVSKVVIDEERASGSRSWCPDNQQTSVAWRSAGGRPERAPRSH